MITKREFLNSLICPTLGWLAHNQKETSTPLTFSQENRFYIGNLIGQKARERFLNGKLISGTNNQSVIATTKMELKNVQNSTFFEAAFEANGFIAKADILIKTGDSYHIIEVKSSTEKDLTKTEGKDYLEDLAYTVWVAKNEGLNVEKASLWFLSSEFRFGDDAGKLFEKIEATELVVGLIPVYDSSQDTSTTQFKTRKNPLQRLKRIAKNANITMCAILTSIL